MVWFEKFHNPNFCEFKVLLEFTGVMVRPVLIFGPRITYFYKYLGPLSEAWDLQGPLWDLQGPLWDLSCL